MTDRNSENLDRFIRRVQSTFTNHEKMLQDCQRQVQQLSRHVAINLSTSNAEQTMEQLERDTAHYTQVVMLAGYAGFLTLWTQTRSEMSLWMFASTGVLISVSLFTFVVFALYKGWTMGRFFSRKPPFRVAELNQAAATANRYWQFAFLVSSVTGLVAGGSLLFWFVYRSVVAAAQLAGAA